MSRRMIKPDFYIDIPQVSEEYIGKPDKQMR